MTNEELASKVEDFMGEVRSSYRRLDESYQEIATRLNDWDLNGAAHDLRSFGHWLREHPDFMRREADEESARVRRQIALAWIADKLHLKDFRKKILWVLSVIAAGFLLAFGTDLYSIKPGVGHVFHQLAEALVK